MSTTSTTKLSGMGSSQNRKWLRSSAWHTSSWVLTAASGSITPRATVLPMISAIIRRPIPGEWERISTACFV